MDPNSQTPAPAAPAADATPPATPPAGDSTPPAGDQQPTAPPVPKTIDPVDHNQPATPPEGDTPPAGDQPPEGDTPPEGDGQQPPEGDDEDPTIASLLDTPEKDDIQQQIDERGTENLPSGVNPDGTVDPLLYAYNQLPEIKVMGKVGNGKVQEVTIRTADDLPDGFRYADARQQTLATQAIAQNMNIAREAIGEAQQWNAQRQGQLAFQQRAAAQTKEIEQLQESGRIPKFTKKPGDKDFANDPGAQRAQQVLDFMNAHNKKVAESGVGQEITSIEFGLTLLEAQEKTQSDNERMGGMQERRNNINSSVSGGSSAPAAPSGDAQRIHRSTQAAVQAGLRRAGKL